MIYRLPQLYKKIPAIREATEGHVVYWSQLVRTIKSHRERRIDDSDLRAIAREIRTANITDKETRSKHNAGVKGAARRPARQPAALQPRGPARACQLQGSRHPEWPETPGKIKNHSPLYGIA